MPSKKKSPSERKKTMKYFSSLRASQERVEYIVRQNHARDEWERQHKYRKHQTND